MPFHCLRCRAELDRSFRACPHCGEPVTDFVRQYAEQPLDGKYRLVARLGTGGMGEVYRVEHTFLGSARVVKVIRPQISENADIHERFLREARLATKVQHPNVATLHDFSALPDGAHYMVWEFIDGQNLGELLRQHGTLPPRQAVRLTIEALHGLEAIHRAGIVHRDISPENLMLTREHGEERVKIIDLGVARSEDGDASVTQTGMFVGKLRYASPEHLGFLDEGERIDGRADLYSLAIVLYEMLTGRPPFEATTPHGYIAQLSRDQPMRSLALQDVPGGPALEAVLRRALERDRTRRYATPRELAAALAEVERSLPERTAAAAPAFDPEATMKVGTRAAAPAVVTVAAPLAAATVIQRTEIVEPPRRRRRRGWLPLVVIVLLVALLVVVWVGHESLFGPRASSSVPAPVAQATVPKPASGAVDVVARNGAAAGSTLGPEAVPGSSKPSSTVPDSTTRSTRSTTPVAPVKAPEAATSSGVYTEGGDSEANGQALDAVRARLSTVKRVALMGEPDATKKLTAALSEQVPAVTVVSRGESPDAVIEFHGNVEHLGFGRKRRSAQATVSMGGRTVLTYKLEPQLYRMGDTPAEAFAKMLANAMQE